MFAFLRGDSVRECVETAVSEEMYERRKMLFPPFYFHDLLASANKKIQYSYAICLPINLKKVLQTSRCHQYLQLLDHAMLPYLMNYTLFIYR